MERFRHALRNDNNTGNDSNTGEPLDAAPFDQRFHTAMDSDLNTPRPSLPVRLGPGD